ncbi:uncharacterized protein BXZ73DRAFT_40632 [Epithele typhae]|uniref:uncharacterized protein n=1 Tax=Epithele typhae TaxID=378194 RepID=UPI002007ABD0|nr:uncharacterized protein BXZ73DRAFT_40632 [Epithele typhae]KAH9943451.1 hypothetical protein BXZ73DRAFT_40632 [Epithele typhae]
MVRATTDSSSATPARRKSEEDLDSNRAHKKPRTRVSYSCGECHRRKQKCDRQVPCSHCVARKVPELCKSYTPGKSDQDIHVRLARLEQIVETALPQYWAQGRLTPVSDGPEPHDKQRSVSPMDDGSHSQAEDEDPSGGIFESGTWYGKSAAGLVAAPAVLEQLQSMVATPDSGSGGSTFPVTHNALLEEESKPNITPMEQSATERLQRLMQDCGYSTERLQNMYDELPPRKFRDELVSHYFNVINWTRYPISENEFRDSYASFLANEHNPSKPSNIRFLPLLFVVLATAVRSAPSRPGTTEASRKTTASRYYWCCRRAMLIVACVQPDCFEIVLTRMLSARFLVLDRRMTESWSQLGAAVRIAQAIGLHRDGADMGMEPLQVERRRRIWAHLYHADRSIALVLGRPVAIHDSHTSTRPPTNADERSFDGKTFKSLPLSQPTRTTFHILRHSLAIIMGRMSDFFQNVNSPRHYSDVIELDDELLNWRQNLPPYYSLDPDTSLDRSHPYIPLQRFLLVTEFLFVRISLHRPYLLRKLDGNKYSRSRDACFESALKDHQTRQEYIATTIREGRDPAASAYREFQAAMIAGIYLALYPKGRDVERMHSLLETFLERNKHLTEIDLIARREIKIIEFLKRKFDGAAEQQVSSVSSPPATSPDANGNVHLLSDHSFPSVASLPLTSPRAAFSQLPRPSPLQQMRYLQPSETSSPGTGTGSPQGEDETAQTLLDQWCNIFSGGPAVDDHPGGTGLPWATPGLVDVNGWLGGNGIIATPVAGGEGVMPPAGVDGADWSYWESLVEQIRTSGSASRPSRICRSVQTMPKRLRSPGSADPPSRSSTKARTDAPVAPSSASQTLPELPDKIRILSWNVDTPAPFLQLPSSKQRSAASTSPGTVPGSHPALLRDLLRRHVFPDFICLQEVRARHTDREWVAALRLAANFGTHGMGTLADSPKYTMFHSLNRAARGQRNFGVATFVRAPRETAIAAAREVDWDHEGRVLVLEMKASWALVNVYALNGSEYMWRDPLGTIAPKTRHGRKREFNRLLADECAALRARGLRVVLVGDFNIVFRELHPNVKAYSWFAKGKPQGSDRSRVDYALVDSRSKENVVEMTYLEDPQERWHSDHAPFVLTVNSMEFGDGAPSID